MKPVAGVTAAVPDAEHQRLKKASQQLEGVFFSQLLSAMRETVQHDGILEQDSGQEMFTSMLDQKIADTSAAHSTHGLGQRLYDQLSRRLPGSA
jgi:Rod binding domain-containing protein